LDIVAVLTESAAMITATPNSEALRLLRAIFDLVDADVRPTADLVMRLLGHDDADCRALLAQLRRAKLVQPETLGLTMAGLVVATRLDPFQPTSLRARVPMAVSRAA
jgi:hypothetical protein